ncbi:hypothetical protein WH47_07071 [Habropoda laboriosa]|uniref:Uncharacterized protein n=1 Tax=Habropoda laboriosa TaxID=597456 RepID=A0A0L7RGP1_9HYME|nr:hypothetical protein WH47_07071 [Habropoda laboriosa]
MYSGILTVAAYVAACICNEGATSLLQFLQFMCIIATPNAHRYICVLYKG